MKINKIVLYNFNSFEGWNEFDFSNEDNGRNIILIGGKNGAGKTSLFTAIKVALYGPLAYGYVGINPHYVSKIKDCINSKAFQTDKVEAKVQITISLMVEREIKEYEIAREWDYTNQKLIENYYVKVDGEQLNEQELSYFENYLQSLIPPDLFEFFLFDGEEVGNIFSSSAYNTYVKNAVYTLCGLDMFEIIRKYTKGYIGKASTKEEASVYNEYERLKQKTEELEVSGEELEQRLLQEAKELEPVEIELIELEASFKNAGGITDAERKKLTQEFQNAEQIKAESVAQIKMFMEGLMPFYILKEFTGKITDQLEYEEKGEIYHYIQNKLSRDDIRSSLSEQVSEASIDMLMELLLSKFKPEGYQESAKPVHDLSKEDTGRVKAMIASVENFDKQGMIQAITSRQQAADRTTEINRTLKSAMSDEDAACYTEKENILLRKKEEITRRIYDDRMKQEDISRQLSVLIPQKDRMLEAVKEQTQNRHVVELSDRLNVMMNTLLSGKIALIKNRLEQLIVENLQHIYRKNNLITHIEIDDDFQINLYQDAAYTAPELVYLLKNLGKEKFISTIGKTSREILFEKYGVDTINQLQQVLLYSTEEAIELYKCIDLSRLSKGERQIFILSLYWAIIELSGQDVPFVIDTPYARIDANHRKEISEKFFPNISKQVIILSTDEEINEEYYRILKPYIAKEYLLINDESQNRTSVEKHYFFGV